MRLYIDELQQIIDKVIEENGIIGVGLPRLSKAIEQYIRYGGLIPLIQILAKDDVRMIDGRQFENPERDSEGNIIARDQYGEIVDL